MNPHLSAIPQTTLVPHIVILSLSAKLIVSKRKWDSDYVPVLSVFSLSYISFLALHLSLHLKGHMHAYMCFMTLSAKCLQGKLILVHDTINSLNPIHVQHTQQIIDCISTLHM